MNKRFIISTLLLSLLATAHAGTPVGAIDGLFAVSQDKHVFFAQGNLIHDNGIWSFAEQQWDVPGEKALFTWASSGYDAPNNVGLGQNICFNTFDGSRFANYDWGVYNAISNGGNVPGLWRTLTREEWLYLLEHHTCEWTTENGQQGLKVMADDNTHYLFLPATGTINIEKDDISDPLTGYYWTSTAATDDAAFAEAYALASTGNTLLANANRSQQMSVRLVYDAPAWTTIADEANNSAVLTPLQNKHPVNVHVMRTLTPGMSNTLTLPFDVSETEIKKLCGEDVTLFRLNTHNTGTINVETQTFDVNITPANAIEAGIPYLITPSKNVQNMHFYDRTIKVASNQQCIVGTPSDCVWFCGLMDSQHLPEGDRNYLFLYPDDTLVWPKEGDTGYMRSLRAYFKVNSNDPSLVIQRLTPRLMITDSTPIEQTAAQNQTPDKCLRNGQLVIRINQLMFNLQGQRIL